MKFERLISIYECWVVIRANGTFNFIVKYCNFLVAAKKPHWIIESPNLKQTNPFCSWILGLWIGQCSNNFIRLRINRRKKRNKIKRITNYDRMDQMPSIKCMHRICRMLSALFFSFLISRCGFCAQHNNTILYLRTLCISSFISHSPVFVLFCFFFSSLLFPEPKAF